jgi:hypothetical protein
MKMKKLVCILVLICVIMGAAFAQAKPAAPAPAKPAASGKINALGLDVFQLIGGVIATDNDVDRSVFIISAGYERLVSPHFSIGAVLDMAFINIGSGNTKRENKYFNIAGEGRYYTSSENFDKFFLGATLGFSQYSIDGSTKAGFTGLSTSLKMGYKVITQKGLYLEPALAYGLEKGTGFNDGWNCGLRLGWVF